MYCKEALKKRPTKLQYKGTYPLTKGLKHQRTRQNKKPSPLTHTHPIYKIYQGRRTIFYPQFGFRPQKIHKRCFHAFNDLHINGFQHVQQKGWSLKGILMLEKFRGNFYFPWMSDLSIGLRCPFPLVMDLFICISCLNNSCIPLSLFNRSSLF